MEKKERNQVKKMRLEKTLTNRIKGGREKKELGKMTI
jgi:hypothetical protein